MKDHETEIPTRPPESLKLGALSTELSQVPVFDRVWPSNPPPPFKWPKRSPSPGSFLWQDLTCQFQGLVGTKCKGMGEIMTDSTRISDPGPPEWITSQVLYQLKLSYRHTGNETGLTVTFDPSPLKWSSKYNMGWEK